MWYFTWLLGVLLACSFGIINVMWLELDGGLDGELDDDGAQQQPAEKAE